MRIKNLLIILIIGLALLIMNKAALAETDLAKRLSGRILIQVESQGQAWYVNPANLKRYYLGRPADAFNLMRSLGIGITNDDLEKIPTKDDAQTDLSFSKLNAGKIFLQVQSSGQAWYVNPLDYKRYYLGRPDNAFSLMREFGLGINNADLNKIPIGYLPASTTPPVVSLTDETDKIMAAAAQAFRQGDETKALGYFTGNARESVSYTINKLESDGLLMLGNILAEAKTSSANNLERIYSTEVYFSLGGYKVPLYFHVKKQADGKWLIENL